MWASGGRMHVARHGTLLLCALLSWLSQPATAESRIGQPDLAALTRPLDFLPDGTNLVLSCSLDAARESAQYPLLLEAAAGWRRSLLTEAGLDEQDLAGITIGENVPAGEMTIVCQLRRPMRTADILAAEGRRQRTHLVVERHGTHIYVSDRGYSFCLPDDRTLVLGNGKLLARVMARHGEAKLSRGLRSALRMADVSAPATLLLDLEPHREQATAGFIPLGRELLRHGRELTMHVDLNERLTFRGDLNCRTAEGAQVIFELAQRQLSLLQRHTPQMHAAGGAPMTLDETRPRVLFQANFAPLEVIGWFCPQ